MTSRSTIDILPSGSAAATRAAYPKTVVIPRSKDGGFGFTVRHYIPYTYDDRAEQLVPASIGGGPTPSNIDVTAGYSWIPPTSASAAATVPVYTTGEPSTAAGAVMFQPEPISNTVYVLFVQPGGTAERAGLREGDRIASVNGRQVSGRTYSQVIQMIKESGGMLELVIEPNDSNNGNTSANAAPWSRDITPRQRTLSPYYARLQRQLSRSAATAPLPFISDTLSDPIHPQQQQPQQLYRQQVMYQHRQHPSAPVGTVSKLSSGDIPQQNISEASSYVSLNSSSSSAVTATSGGSSTITTINLASASNSNRPTPVPPQQLTQQQIFPNRSPSPSVQRSYHHPSELRQQQQQHQQPAQIPPQLSPRPQNRSTSVQQQSGMPPMLTDAARTSSLISLTTASPQPPRHPLKPVTERRDSKTMFAGLRLASLSLSTINDVGIDAGNSSPNNNNSPVGASTNISPTTVSAAGDLHGDFQSQPHRRLQQSDSAATASSEQQQSFRTIRPLSQHSWTQPIAALPPGMRSSGAYALRTRTDGALPMPIGGIAFGGVQSPPPFAREQRGRSPTPDTTTTATTLSATSAYVHAHPSFAGRRTLQQQHRFQREDSANASQQQHISSSLERDNTEPLTEPIMSSQPRPSLEKWKLYNSYPKPYPGGSVASPPPPYQQQFSNVYSSSSVDSLLSTNRDQQQQLPPQSSNVRSASSTVENQRTIYDYPPHSPDYPREQQQQRRYGAVSSPSRQGMITSIASRA